MPPADSEGEMQEKPVFAWCNFHECYRDHCRDKHAPCEPPSVPPMTQAEKSEQDRALYRTVERESVPPQRVEPGFGEMACRVCRRIVPISGERKTCEKCRAKYVPEPRVDSVEPPASRICMPHGKIGCGTCLFDSLRASQEGPSEGATVAMAWLAQCDVEVAGHQFHVLRDLIDSALSSKGVAVRDEALEEAAKVAETEPSQWTCTESIEHAVVSSRCIAAGIRALKERK